ncbi:hypothetical protein [Leifsonia virtsii]|uniref:DUF2283 domain-containing protein n=1 Tax=Leifsonia virtsii TaxID=3035915 RepID=A0ABT8ITZ8_9MICO|nr:hypothetical protein [Leifsonia virtsii]MDN4596255.1 hypothetical protein [Leifsonia virtsii]
MGPYRFQIASDVSTRDGIAVELVDASGERLLEVFRDDGHDGALTFNSFGTVSVSFDAAAKLVELARQKLVDAAPPGLSSSAPFGDTEKKDKK